MGSICTRSVIAPIPVALSAGGHWNVGDGGHGDPAMPGHHTGDLGNLTAAADGTASLVFSTDEWVVDAPFVGGVRQPNDVVGRAVIVHAAADDLVTQPTGNSGGRVACGVIGIPAPAPTTAFARIDPRSGSLLSGRATFRQTAAGVALQLDVSGVSPGPHAIHVHDRGDCSGFDALTAGPHWNPDSMMHGLPDGGVHHLGDLGNLDIAPDGTGSFSFTNPGWDIVGANSVLGHAFIVHGGTDDGTSQPAGDAGPRIGCGLITLDNQQPAAPRSVDFVLSPKSGSTATGRLRLVETGNAVTAQVEVFNVPPRPHGVHLHVNPDCSAADGTSAGGHWNPDNAMHGVPTLGHVGDMGNIDVDDAGHGVLTMLSPRWMMGDGGVVMAPQLPDGGADSRYPDGGWVRYDLMGHALILHAGTDDLMTQPTGDAGARIACGVLR